MTRSQRTALAHPCLLAEETTHPRFIRWVDRRLSVVLTVNAGYE